MSNSPSVGKAGNNLPPPTTEFGYRACAELLQSHAPTTPEVARALNAFHLLISEKFGIIPDDGVPTPEPVVDPYTPPALS